jgi:phosphatidylglycerol:prolipoprotein diacylglycerol transferase
MLPVLMFPQFDPVLVHLGPISIRWYAIAYIAGIVLGWRLLRHLVRATPIVASLLQADDFLTWATLGIVLGGRIGYVLFYNFDLYLAHPLAAFKVWDGGMSFHGGAIGVTIAILIFCRRNRISILGFADRLAVCVPIGLGFGRIANFINGELWGRQAPAWLPWAMYFPQASRDGVMVPRHPSEIYQALMEGLILFCVLYALSRREWVRARFGMLTGVFLVGYAIARAIGELFRQPDAQLGYLWLGLTMGQILSLPMLIGGAWLLWRALRRPPAVVVV